MLMSSSSQTMLLVATCAQNTPPSEEQPCSDGLVHSSACVPSLLSSCVCSGSSKLFAEQRRGKDHRMPPFFLLLLFLLICACAYVYWAYPINRQKQAREKKRNQYDDRI